MGADCKTRCSSSYVKCNSVSKLHFFGAGPALNACPKDRNTLNPLVPDAHYSERQDKSFSLRIQRLEVDLKLNWGFLFLHPGH